MNSINKKDYTQIKLPIINRRIALMRVLYIGGIFIAFSLFTADKYVIWITISLNIILFTYIFWRKNIRKAYLKNEKIIVTLNTKIISIPIEYINSINPALSKATSLKGHFFTIFTLELKRKYAFGNKLLLEFEHDEIPINEPLIISQIKAIMKYNHNKTPND